MNEWEYRVVVVLADAATEAERRVERRRVGPWEPVPGWGGS